MLKNRCSRWRKVSFPVVGVSRGRPFTHLRVAAQQQAFLLQKADEVVAHGGLRRERGWVSAAVPSKEGGTRVTRVGDQTSTALKRTQEKRSSPLPPKRSGPGEPTPCGAYLELPRVQLSGQGKEGLRVFLGEDGERASGRSKSAPLGGQAGQPASQPHNAGREPARYLEVVDLKDGFGVWQVVLLQVGVQPRAWGAEVRDACS